MKTLNQFQETPFALAKNDCEALKGGGGKGGGSATPPPSGGTPPPSSFQWILNLP